MKVKKLIITVVSIFAILYLFLCVLAFIFGSSPGKISKDLVIRPVLKLDKKEKI